MLLVAAKAFVTPTSHEDRPFIIRRTVIYVNRDRPDRMQLRGATMRAIKTDQTRSDYVVLINHLPFISITGVMEFSPPWRRKIIDSFLGAKLHQDSRFAGRRFSAR